MKSSECSYCMCLIRRVSTIGLGLVLFFAYGCSDKKEQDEKEKVILVNLMTAKSVGYDKTQRYYVGVVEESTASSLSFQTMGTVQEVYVTEGQKVSSGQLLASLNKEPKESDYKAAASALRQAQDLYDRMTILYENNSLPEVKYIDVQTALEQAKSNEYTAKKNLKDCNLYAPFPGVIGARNVEPGGTVSSLQPAFNLMKVDLVKVKVAIPEKEIGFIRKGLNAKVIVSALNNDIYEGSISEKGVIANPLSHTYDVKIDLSNEEFKLLPGMVCKVYIDKKGRNLEYIVLPNRAVQIAPDGQHFVWIEENGIAHRRFVTIGELSSNGINIEKGISANENVIIDGYQKISEGMKVKPVNNNTKEL